jgi:hypothetical protein
VALLEGGFAVVAPEAYRKIRNKGRMPSYRISSNNYEVSDEFAGIYIDRNYGTASITDTEITGYIVRWNLNKLSFIQS